MGIRKLSIILVLVSLLINSNIYKVNANGSINFKNITIEDGLSQSSVESIFQDSNGYIWMGTNDGLNRYNGYEFKTYKKNQNTGDTLVSNYITDIKEDKQGNIWVGTTNGVSKIDTNNDIVTNYLSSKDNGNLSNANICEILITKDGSILIATNDGLNLYKEEEDKFVRILGEKDDLSSQSIYSIVEDEYGDLWIGTDYGLNKLDIKSQKIEKIYSNEDKNSISDNFIYKIYYDRNGYIWIGTYSGGLNKIDIKTKKISVYRNKRQDKDSLASNNVRNILRDSKDNLWVCTSKGLSQYIDKEDKFITYTSKLYEKYSLVDNNIFSIIEDSSGLLWVGTYRGISTFDPNNKIDHYKNNPLDKNSISDNSVHGIYEDEDGLLWVGTSLGGVNIIDLKNETVDHITKEDGLNSNNINAIVGDEDAIWVATNSGLNRIDRINNSIRNYSDVNGLESSKIKSLYIDTNNCLWVGSSEGINILNLENNEMLDITYILDENMISDKYIESIYQDKEGDYWIGTFVEGYLLKLDKNNKTIKNYKDYIDSNVVRTITDDNNGYLWVGTGDGLNRLDKKTEEVIRYCENDGLTNNNIYGILVDEEENPWMSTNDGISKLEISRNKFVNFYVEDGLQSKEFNGGASYKNSNGEFLFGGINGLNIFNPKEIDSQNYHAKVAFDEFIVKGESYKDINNLKFKSSDNMINIKFFFPSYKNKSSIQYQYKIDETDKEWSHTNNNEVIYNNLDPGRYTFKIRARNHNGVISGESSVKFTIKPPIWLSPLAFIIYIILIGRGIYSNRNKMKKLDKLVDKRTKELISEMKKSKQLLNKIIHLERNKNNYFINLSHELRTPLNVISTTEQLITTLNKNEPGLPKNKLDYHMTVMRRNTKRLLNLINNIIDTAKVEHGNYKMIINEHDIVYIVEEAALSLKDYIESNGIKLIIDPSIEEKNIQCDKHEIERCIVNLISNAAKFTPDGGRIEVGIDDLGNQVAITIKDTGIGIDLKYHNSIFDRFNQIIDENAEVNGGSGLGLTITKHIVDLHNGEIFVESKVNEGSIFTIILNEKINK